MHTAIIGQDVQQYKLNVSDWHERVSPVCMVVMGLHLTDYLKIITVFHQKQNLHP